MTALKAFELRSLNHPIWISNICCYCIFLRTGYGLYQTYFSGSLENGLIISRFQLKLSGKNEEETQLKMLLRLEYSNSERWTCF